MPNSPFHLLCLPLAFDLTPAAIEAAYLGRIAAAHPDATGDTAATEISELNHARIALLNPETRAAALLDALEGPSARDCPDLPPDFLFQIMDQRMQIEEELKADPAAARPKWSAWANQQRTDLIESLKPLFAKAASKDRKILRDLRTGLNAWRYIERLLEQLSPSYDPNRADFSNQRPSE